jgi:hypothetical protein
MHFIAFARRLMRALSAMKNLVATILLFWSANAWSCTCLGTASIEETIANQPILVVAQVVRLERVTSELYGSQVDGVTLKVIKKLKGSVTSDTITVEHSVCYASLYPELMKVGHTYVLPLSEPINRGRNQMAECAHTGMELIAGKLYTFEQAKGLERRLQFYKNYSEFLSGFEK